VRRKLFNLAAAVSLVLFLAALAACAVSRQTKFAVQFERHGQKWRTRSPTGRTAVL
jgi:hypothetical protein